MRFSLRMPLRFLRGSYTKMALTVVALASGVALVCAIDLVDRAVTDAFTDVIDTMAGRASLGVTAGEGGLLPESVADTVAKVPGVELAVPVVNAAAFIEDGSGDLLTVRGVDVGNEAAIRAYQAKGRGGLELEDPLVFLSQPDSIILTDAFATRKGIDVGDRVTLMTPGGARRFTVRGLLQPEGIARVYGGNVAVMDLFAAEVAFTQPGFVNAVDLIVGRQADIQAVARAVEEVLPSGLKVEAPAQRKADLHKVMRSLDVALRAIGLTGLITAFLIAFNRSATSFEARGWQVGILRAVGMRARAVWLELIGEGAILGGLGVLLGVPLGAALGRLLLPVITTSAALGFKLVPPESTFSVRPASLILAAVLGLGAAILASALPAWRASRVEVAETLRSRDVEQHGMNPVAMWVSRALVALGIVVTVLAQALTGLPIWGLAATGLIAVGTAMSARPLLNVLGTGYALRLRRLLGPTVTFAVGNLLRNPRRTALTVATLGVGLGSVLWLGILSASFEQSVIQTVAGVVRADLVISSSHIASGTVTAPLDEDLVNRLRDVQGVRSVVGVRRLDWHYADGPIALNALDGIYFTDHEFGMWPLFGKRLAGVWEAVARGEAVIVSTNLVMNVPLRVGDAISLDTPQGELRVVVGGVTLDFNSPRGTIEMSRELFKRYWSDPLVTEIDVSTLPQAAAHVRDEIARTYGARFGLRILSSSGLVEYFATQVRRAFAPLDVMAVMFVFVVWVGMADTMAAGVAERTRELGAVRALGARRSYLRRVIVLEGVLLGGLGILLGIAAGLSMGVLWVEMTFPHLLGWVLDLYIPLRYCATLTGVSALVCAVASLIPARQATRLQPAVALRYE